MPNEMFTLVDLAVSGNKKALEDLILSVEDMIFNLSLRMLGSPQDAEDATQEIYIRIITGLGSLGLSSSSKSLNQLQKIYVCKNATSEL